MGEMMLSVFGSIHFIYNPNLISFQQMKEDGGFITRPTKIFINGWSRLWIPACAGMTGEEDNGISSIAIKPKRQNALKCKDLLKIGKFRLF
jgi:hypothetical protein